MESSGHGAVHEATSFDQRAGGRAAIRLRVDYERMNAFFADYTRNISKGGTFIKSSQPLPIGTRFLFALAVPGLSLPIVLNGEVAWTREPGAGRGEPGMGVRFVFDTPESRRQFEALVERLIAENLGPEAARALLGA